MRRFSSAGMQHAAGFPKIGMLMSDNGGEFCGNEMVQFLAKTNTVHKVTPPYTPASNGKIERVHALVDLNMTNLMQGDPDLSEDQALAWSVFAYNSVEMSSGFAPVQLVFGPTDNRASIADMTPAEAQLWDSTLRYAELLKSRQQAILNHNEIKTRSKFRNILLRKATPTPEAKHLGQWVWLLRHDQYLGPGQVASSLESQCQVKIGNRYYHAHFRDLIPLNQSEINRLTAISHNLEKQPELLDVQIPENTVNVDNLYMSNTELLLQEHPEADHDHTDEQEVEVVMDNI